MFGTSLNPLNRPSSREMLTALVIALTLGSLAGCERDASLQSRVAAMPELSGDFKFPLVHTEDKTPDGRCALRLDSERGTLEVTYIDGSVVGRTATVKVGMQPVSVRVSSNHEAWVVDPIADSISIVDLDSAIVVAALPTAPQPTDVVFAGSPLRAYVTVAQGRELLVWDSVAPTEPLTRIALQLGPRHATEDDFASSMRGPGR